LALVITTIVLAIFVLPYAFVSMLAIGLSRTGFM
jgi:hypothetical protein